MVLLGRGTRKPGRRVAVGLAAVLVASVLGVASAPVSGASTCSLDPVLRDFEVSQGLPYAKLVPGKTTVVRPRLSLPSCADSKASIQLKSATLTVTTPTLTTPGVAAANNPAPLGPFPLMATHSAAPAINPPSAGDPVFKVAGTAFPAPLVAAEFTATFSVSVTYLAKTSSTDVGTTRTATFQGSALFGKATKPLRILVVPMGDGSASATQFSSADRAAVVAGLERTVARTFPVADGVGPIGTGSAGLQYEISSGLLDLGPAGLGVMPAGGRFCGTATRFETAMAPALAAKLDEYNSKNPAKQAGRVLGVIGASVSSGIGVFPNSCDEGRAMVGGREAWTRAIPAGQGSSALPDPVTGAISGMELAHTYRLVFGAPGSHSANAFADVLHQDKGVALVDASPLPDPPSVMQLSTGGIWKDGAVLLEPAHWDAIRECGRVDRLTADPNCGESGVTSAAAGSRIVLVGTIHVEGAGPSEANVTESYFTADGQPESTSTEPSRWVLRQGSRVDPVPVQFESSEHESETHDEHTGTFDGAWPAEGNTFQLVDTLGTATTADDVVLYERTRNAAPAITATSQDADANAVQPGSATNFTDTPATSDQAPALSGTGLVAWARGGSLVVGRTTSPATAITVRTGGTHPVFTSDGSWLAYEVGGAIEMVRVTATGPMLSVSSPTVVYQRLGGALPAAHRPTFAPFTDGPGTSPRWLAFEVEAGVGNAQAGIFLVDRQPGPLLGSCTLDGVAGGAACQRLTTGGTGAAWAPYGSHLAFSRSGNLWTLDTTMDDPAPPGAAVDLGVAGTTPSWADGHLAFARDGNVWVTDPAGPLSAQRFQAQVTTGGGDAEPSLTWAEDSGLAAFQRGGDVYLLPLSDAAAPTDSARVITATVQDETPANVRGQVLLDCGGVLHPLGVGLVPFDTQQSTARFRLRWDPSLVESLSCGGGQLVVGANDGYLTASAAAGPAGTSAKAPLTAITHPAPDTSFGSNQLVVLAATAHDAEDGALGAAAFDWVVTGLSGTTSHSGTDRLELDLAPGDYTAAVTATDSDGNASSAQVSFTVEEQHAPVPSIAVSPANPAAAGSPVTISGSATDEEDGTLPATSFAWRVTGPSVDRTEAGVASFQFTPPVAGIYAVSLDVTDSSGLSGHADRTFTVGTAVVADATFDPSTLTVPPDKSDAKWVTMRFQAAGRNMAEVVGSSVRLTSIGGIDVSSDPRFVAQAWTLEPPNGVAKFDRQAIAEVLMANGLVDRTVRFVAEGRAQTFFFQGAASAYVQSKK